MSYSITVQVRDFERDESIILRCAETQSYFVVQTAITCRMYLPYLLHRGSLSRASFTDIYLFLSSPSYHHRRQGEKEKKEMTASTGNVVSTSKYKWISFLFCILVPLNFYTCHSFPLPKILKTSQSDWKVLKRYRTSTLYAVVPEGMTYDLGAPMVLKLSGNRTEVGYAAGVLMGKRASASYETFMKKKFKESAGAYEKAMDYLYKHLLQRHIPAEFEDELNALTLGAWDGGVVKSTDVGAQQRRIIALATLPADLANIIRMIEQDFNICSKDPQVCVAIHKWEEKNLGPKNVPYANGTWPKFEVGNPLSGHCDFLGVWGSRTEDGRLFSTRNLDWEKDTGIAKEKLITVYDIDGLQSPYATVGFGAFLSGAVAGISKNGITVSEANLDNSNVSFDGFPWPLRLRYIMEKSNNLEDARSIWQKTSNTAAFNFLIGSSSDAPFGPAAMAMETMANYTAYFYDNSPIEANATWQWPNSSTTTKIGFPIPDAVFRSNHGLDPRLMKTQENLWNDTVWRYKEMHDLILQKSADVGKITLEYVVYIASVLGIKGPNYFSCSLSQFKAGNNIMSIVFDPSLSKAYAAWEDGTGSSWRPAACNEYIEFDLTEVFESAPK